MGGFIGVGGGYMVTPALIVFGFPGYIGHYHLTEQKWDPGPFDFKEFCRKLRGAFCFPVFPRGEPKKNEDKPAVPEQSEKTDKEDEQKTKPAVDPFDDVVNFMEFWDFAFARAEQLKDDKSLRFYDSCAIKILQEWFDARPVPGFPRPVWTASTWSCFHQGTVNEVARRLSLKQQEDKKSKEELEKDEKNPREALLDDQEFWTFAAEENASLQKTHPKLTQTERAGDILVRHKDPMASVTTVLNRLVEYGEARSLTNDRGRRVWEWVSETDAGSEPIISQIGA